MEIKKVLLEYQTPTVETVIVFDEIYTGQLFEGSDDIGDQYPWD